MVATPPRGTSPFVARPTRATVTCNTTGVDIIELWFTATDTGILVVNKLPVENLRGVVPTELGTRAPRRITQPWRSAGHRGAQLRGVHARSERNRSRRRRVMGSAATVQNQVYTGADGEHPIVNQAIDATSGGALPYGGLLVDAAVFVVVRRT
jgi:stage II sporulation protein D